MGEWLHSIDAGALQLRVNEMFEIHAAYTALLIRSRLSHSDEFPSELTRLLKKHLNCAAPALTFDVRTSGECFISISPLGRELHSVVTVLLMLCTGRCSLPFSVTREIFAAIVADIESMPPDIGAGLALGLVVANPPVPHPVDLWRIVLDVLRFSPMSFPIGRPVPLLFDISSGALIKLMIDECGFDPNMNFHVQYIPVTPLHVARNGEVVRALIAGGARIDYKQNARHSALYAQVVFRFNPVQTIHERVSAAKALQNGSPLELLQRLESIRDYMRSMTVLNNLFDASIKK